ncbi:oxygen-dependent protoporphyrinogen oxidase [Vanrija albida]|uniref:Protoporphyrinogen oxidase n=1 Tax=Vanrija albida TaxID=181172 RepID=A0ABR3QBX2_9TREE
MTIPRAPARIAVLGAGLSGLTAAYRLSSALPGARIHLLDGARQGGWVKSDKHRVSFVSSGGERLEGEITCEAGPRSIRPRGGPGAPAMLKLIRDAGLEPAIVPIPTSHPAARNRYLLTPGGLERVAPTPIALLKPSSASAALFRAVAAEPFRRPPAPYPADESVASFFTRRFGARVAHIASAFVHGIYAADPAQLSLRSAFGILHDAEKRYGSVVLGMLRGVATPEAKAAERAAWAELGGLGKKREGWSMYALRGGMGALTARLGAAAAANGVDVRCGPEGRVTALQRTGDGVEISLPSGPLEVDHVVSALPPRRLAQLAPLPNLTANPSTTVGVVNVVYPLPPGAIHPDGFGYLIPRDDASRDAALGVVFDSTALPGTGDGLLEGKLTKLTVMMGGPYWGAYGGTAPSSPDALVAPALAHLQRTFPALRDTEPLLVTPHLNAECIPTYAPGHGARLRETHEAIARDWAGRLSVVGAGYGGVSVNDCVLGAELVAAGLGRGEAVTGLERWSTWE